MGPLATTDPLVIALSTALLGGGGLAALGTFLRAPKQAKLDLVQASKVIYDELRGEIDYFRDRVEECERDRDSLRIAIAGERGEIEWLRDRISVLEARIGIHPPQE